MKSRFVFSMIKFKKKLIKKSNVNDGKVDMDTKKNSEDEEEEIKI